MRSNLVSNPKIENRYYILRNCGGVPSHEVWELQILIEKVDDVNREDKPKG